MKLAVIPGCRTYSSISHTLDAMTEAFRMFCEVIDRPDDAGHIRWPLDGVVEQHFTRLPTDTAVRSELERWLKNRFEQPDEAGRVLLPVLQVMLDDDTCTIRVVADPHRQNEMQIIEIT